MSWIEPSPDLLVVGAGVIGLATAREAAARGMRVTVLERDEPAMSASWAAAGMLSPLGEAHGPGAYLDFGLESLHMYADWVEGLEQESGIDVEYRECGKLRVALSDPGMKRLKLRREWAAAAGLTAEWLEPEGIRRLEPRVSSAVRAGLLVHEDYRVDNRALGRALSEAARRSGVEIRPGMSVRSIRSAEGRVQGVTLEDGTSLDGSAVLIAAGAWSGSIGGLPSPLPVRPVRGQMLALDSPIPPPAYVVEADDVYLVPRDDGRLLVGATQEEAGFHRGNTAAGVRGLLGAALGLLTDLEEARVLELWSGLRPGTQDGHPLLGPHPEIAGLFVATGHFRNGILLAPATARRLGALVSRGEAGPLPPDFVPDRFQALERSAGHP